MVWPSVARLPRTPEIPNTTHTAELYKIIGAESDDLEVRAILSALARLRYVTDDTIPPPERLAGRRDWFFWNVTLYRPLRVFQINYVYCEELEGDRSRLPYLVVSGRWLSKAELNGSVSDG